MKQNHNMRGNTAYLKVFKQMITLLIAFTTVLIIIGSCIRMTNSGLSCPDWPLCYGLWLPTYSKIHTLPNIAYGFNQVVFEWLHRFLAGFLIGIMVFLLTGYSIFLLIKKIIPGYILYLYSISILLLITQVVLGSLTVFEQNQAWTVALHLLTALLFLSILWSIRTQLNLILFSTSLAYSESIDKIKRCSYYSLILALFTMCAGAMMAKSGASYDYLNKSFFYFVLHIHEDRFLLLLTAHILGSFLLSINNMYMYVCAKKNKMDDVIFIKIKYILILTLFEILIGIILSVYSIPLMINLMHEINSIIIMSLITIVYWNLHTIQINRNG